MSLRKGGGARPMAVLFVGSVVLACNVLSGADELGACEGAACEATPGEPDASVDQRRASATAIPDGSNGGGDAGSCEPASDSGSPFLGPDASPPCTTMCDGSACCAPDTCVIATGKCGACSGANGPCQVDGDCCSGFVCSGRGTCVRTCTKAGGTCFLSGCCLGSKCQLPTCVACGLHGSACDQPSDCCSGNCTANACVGNTGASGG